MTTPLKTTACRLLLLTQLQLYGGIMHAHNFVHNLAAAHNLMSFA